MKHKLLRIVYIFFCLPILLNGQQEFIKPKKKEKQESAAKIQQDVADLLEIIVRQIGTNIQQSVVVQNQVIDQIKSLMHDNSQSIDKLKQARCKLEQYLKKLEEQQLELQNFLLSCR